MWKCRIFQGNDLIVEHAQADYGKVLRFTINGLVELMNNNVQDFRVVMNDKQGYVYFMCIGPTTHVVNINKNKEGEKNEPPKYLSLEELLGGMKV